MEPHVMGIVAVGGSHIPPCAYCQTQHTFLLDLVLVPQMYGDKRDDGRTFFYICRKDCMNTSRVLRRK